MKDCSGQNAKINVFGISKQETRSGKNKLDIALLAKELTNGISYTYENKKIHVEGTATATTPSSIVNVADKLEVGKKYVLSINKSNNDNVIAIANIQYSDNTPGTWLTSFTFTDNIKKVNVYLQVANSATVNVDVTAQLEEGEVATEYEQYGASPSPEFPSEIENVVGDIDITISNKNLFDGVFSQGYDSKGNITSSNQFVCNTNLIDVVENESYTISNNLNLKIASIAYYKDNEFVSFQANLNLATITIPQNVNQIRFNFYKEPTLNISDFIYCQFEKNVVATDYIEHEEQIITFPLEEGQKMYVGSKTEDDGIHHIIKQIELDGTENVILFEWTKPHNKTTMFKVLKIIAKKTDAIKFCNYFKRVKNTAENLDKDEEYCLSDITGAIHFSISNEIATTVEQFKNWLAQKKQEGKSLIVEYDLLEEEIEEYTEEQQEANSQLQNAKTYKTVTNVFTENAEVEMEYVAHTKTYIDNQINQRLSNIENQILELAGGN